MGRRERAYAAGDLTCGTIAVERSVGVSSVSPLHHLLVVLCAEAVIAAPRAGTTPVDAQLQRFDQHLDQVRDLALKARAQFRRTVCRSLREDFADGRIDLAAITPDDMREFVARQSALHHTPGGAASLLSALQGCLRLRTTCGDRAHGLSRTPIVCPRVPSSTRSACSGSPTISDRASACTYASGLIELNQMGRRLSYNASVDAHVPQNPACAMNLAVLLSRHVRQVHEHAPERTEPSTMRHGRQYTPVSRRAHDAGR